jgi:hypothetical protein
MESSSLGLDLIGGDMANYGKVGITVQFRSFCDAFLQKTVKKSGISQHVKHS